MSVELVHSIGYIDPGYHFRSDMVTLSADYSDTLLLTCYTYRYTNIIEDSAWNDTRMNRIKGYPVHSYPGHIAAGSMQVKVFYMLDPEPGYYTWSSIWYADNPAAVAMLFYFAGVDQSDPFGSIAEYVSNSTDAPEIEIDAEIGDYSLAVCGTQTPSTEVLTPNSGWSSLFDLSSASANLYRMKVLGKNPSLYNPEIAGYTGESSRATAIFGIPIHPTNNDAIQMRSRRFFIM